jgi:hypothetical protein
MSRSNAAARQRYDGRLAPIFVAVSDFAFHSLTRSPVVGRALVSLRMRSNGKPRCLRPGDSYLARSARCGVGGQ